MYPKYFLIICLVCCLSLGKVDRICFKGLRLVLRRCVLFVYACVYMHKYINISKYACKDICGKKLLYLLEGREFSFQP